MASHHQSYRWTEGDRRELSGNQRRFQVTREILNHPRIKALSQFISRLKNADGGRGRVLKNIAWLFFDKGFRMGLGVVVTVWTARYLGPEQYGILNYLQAIVTVFVTIAMLGMDQVAVKAIIDAPTKATEIIANVFTMRFVVSVAFFLICCGIMFFDDNFILGVYLSSVLFFNPLIAIDLYFQSKLQSKYTVLAQTIAFILASGLRIWLITTRASLEAFGIAFMVEAALAGFGMLYFYMRTSGHRLWFELKLRMPIIKDIVRQSWPLMFSGMMIMIYMKIDQIMLGQLSGAEAVGIYASALKISEIWYFIPAIISNSVYPLLIKAKQDNDLLYRERLQMLMNVLVLISVSVALVLTFAADPLVIFLYGEAYRGAGIVLSIHIWISVFVFINIGGGLFYIIEDLSKKVFVRSVSGALLNAALNLILIPRYQGVGAAMATLVAQLFVTYIFDALNKTTRPLFFVKTRSLLLLEPLKMSVELLRSKRYRDLFGS